MTIFLYLFIFFVTLLFIFICKNIFKKILIKNVLNYEMDVNSYSNTCRTVNESNLVSLQPSQRGAYPKERSFGAYPNEANAEYSIRGKKEQGKSRGICYFDIDGTLTTSLGSVDNIMNKCLENNFKIGIITASTRTLDMLCDKDKAKVPWMGDILCEQFNKDPSLFNSAVSLAGRNVTYPFGSPGFKKGYAMSYGKKLNNILKDKCIVLFDDDPNFMTDVKNYNNNLEVQCSGKGCGGDTNPAQVPVRLTADLVLGKINNMIKNGC
jgi:hypothetical protein